MSQNQTLLQPRLENKRYPGPLKRLQLCFKPLPQSARDDLLKNLNHTIANSSTGFLIRGNCQAYPIAPELGTLPVEIDQRPGSLPRKLIPKFWLSHPLRI